MSQDPVSPQDAAGDANPSANPAEGAQAQAPNGETASAAPVRNGNVGAGSGATVGKVHGPERAMKGGVGHASVQVGPWVVAAMVACNAVGDVLDDDPEQESAPGRFQLGQAAIVLRQHMVAVAFHKAVAGKMLAAGFHAAFV